MSNSLTITIAIIGLISTLLGIYVQLRKLRTEDEAKKKAEADKEAKVLQMLDNDKKRLDKLDGVIDRIDQSTDIQGDMIYAMLSHMATNNATGQMQSALDKYNAYYRRNH